MKNNFQQQQRVKAVWKYIQYAHTHTFSHTHTYFNTKHGKANDLAKTFD